MAPLDLGPKAGAEALLRLELDAVLLGQRARERGPETWPWSIRI
jgi:hypothetical protein